MGNVRKTLRLVLSTALLGCFAGRSVWGDISVDFDQEVYFVTGPGEIVEAIVLLDADADTPAVDLLANGLFSFGVKASFDPSKAELSGVSDASVPAALDYFGFASGAFLMVSPGMAGAKGNIDQLSFPLDPYASPQLVTLRITNLASAPGSYPLDLDFFRTVGPNEQLFLDGEGNVLDGQIELGTALVVVIPEPATGALGLAAIIFFVMGHSLVIQSLGLRPR